MRRVIRAALAVAVAAGAVAVLPGTAQAGPSVRQREWWFGAWQIQRIWQTTKGAGVTVAVLDTGVNARLPELAGAVLPGGDVTGSGTDGRTDVDEQDSGHGTSMAALIVGQGTGTGLLGVAPEAKVLPVLTNAERAGEDAATTDSAAIRFAADHGAKVISISQAASGIGFPGNCPTKVQDAVRYAIEQKDAVVVAGAGNEGDGANDAVFPAACRGVLAVGAVDSRLNPWASTQRQSYVSVGAPGVDVVSVSSAGRAVIGDGTSPATALVSGALALIRSRYPSLDARQVVARVLATVRDAGPPGKDDTSGYGAVRPFNAITTKVPADAPNPVFDALKDAAPSATPTPPPASGEPRPAPSATSAAGSASNDSTGSGSLFPLAFALVIGLVVVLFVTSTLVRRRRRRPAFGGPAPWPPTPAQAQQPPHPGAPGQQWPPQQWPPQSTPPGYPPQPPPPPHGG